MDEKNNRTTAATPPKDEYRSAVDFCRAYGGPIQIIQLLCQFREQKHYQRQIKRNRNALPPNDATGGSPKTSIQHERNQIEIRPKYCEAQFMEIMAASLAIACKYSTSIQNEIMSSVHIIHQMMNCIQLHGVSLLAENNSQECHTEDGILRTYNAIIFCFIDCIMCILNQFYSIFSCDCYDSFERSDVGDNVDDDHRKMDTNSRGRRRRRNRDQYCTETKVDHHSFDDFVISCCIEKGCIVHCFIQLFFDIIFYGTNKNNDVHDKNKHSHSTVAMPIKKTKSTSNTNNDKDYASSIVPNYSNRSGLKLLKVLIRAMRSFFITLNQTSSTTTIAQVFAKIPLKQLFRSIISIISNRHVSTTIFNDMADMDSEFTTQIYGLLGDVLVIVWEKKQITIENDLFNALSSEEVLLKLLLSISQGAEMNSLPRNFLLSIKSATFIIDTILQSCLIEVIYTTSKQQNKAVLETIVRSVVENESALIHKKMFDQMYLHQWTGILACYWKLSSDRITVLSSNSTFKKKRKSLRRKKQKPIPKQDVMKFMFEKHLIVPLTWALVHSNQSIKSNAEETLNFFSNNIRTLLRNEQLMYLLQRGYIKILYAIQEKCRIEGRNQVVEISGRILAEIKFKLYSITTVKSTTEVDCYVDIFNSFCHEMGATSASKPLIMNELFLLHIHMIRTSESYSISNRKNDNSFHMTNGGPFMLFSWDKIGDIFVVLKQAVKLLHYFIRNEKATIRSHNVTMQNSTSTITEKKIVAKVYCEDKCVNVLMECAPMQKLLSNAPLLAKLVKTASLDKSSLETKCQFNGDGDGEFTFDLSVLSYTAFEEYLCHIDFGLEHQKQEMIQSYDIKICLQLIRLAHRFGSEHLIPEYFSICHELMEISSLPPTYIDVLEVAIEVSSNQNILRTLQFLLKEQELFVGSLHFISKQKSIEQCINRLMESIILHEG